MRTAYHLRRYKAAAEHWQAAVHLARMAGLLRLAWQERTPYPPDGRAAAHPPQPFAQRFTTLAATSADLAHHASSARSPSPTAACSSRESEILALMAQGCINKEIAKQMDISEGTVKTHRKRIDEKLDVRSRSQALQKAKDWLLI